MWPCWSRRSFDGGGVSLEVGFEVLVPFLLPADLDGELSAASPSPSLLTVFHVFHRDDSRLNF